MATKNEIMAHLMEIGVGELADIKTRNNTILVPPHRVIAAGFQWDDVADKLEAFGFSGRGTLAMSIKYSGE
jgi:hypothetical protein